MIYFVAFHLLAGAVTGAVFTVRVLLGLLGIVLIESVVAALVQGAAAGIWALSALVTIQVGYLAGVLGRAALEQARLAARRVGKARLP